jgi:glycosyltransferase involved in cell wall biosynthesis
MPPTNTQSVLQLIAPTHFGGAERVVLDLAEAIDRAWFRVVIGAFVNVRFPENPFIEQLKERRVPHKIFWLTRTLDVENIVRLLRTIQKEKIDIVHTHGYRSDILGGMAAKITRRPVVSTLHGWVPIDARLAFYERCDRFALRFFDRVLPVSDQMKKALAASGIPRRNIVRLHNAVSLDTEIRPHGGGGTVYKSDGQFLIGIIGRLSPEKDVASFLEAARMLSHTHRRVTFLVVGDGPERESLERRASRSDLKGRVAFAGFVNEMAPVYQDLDLLVISSKTEGIPLVVLEAMKHGIPVVSTRVGGIPEVIEDGVDGILVPPGDPPAMARAIETLLLDGGRYRQMARQARLKIAADFNRANWIKTIEAIYRSLI